MLCLDHQSHDTARGARGSSAKRDDVDVACIMKRKGNSIELKLGKGRGAWATRRRSNFAANPTHCGTFLRLREAKATSAPMQ